MKLFFVTVNDFKAKEVQEYLKASGVELHVVKHPIQEILNIDLSVIVRDKALKAYRELGRPCVVEHGGLLIDALKGLPGGLSKVVWDTVGDKLCRFIDASDSRVATAQSVIGYCDGRRIHLHVGETKGIVADRARGDYMFQWDPIFIPDGQSKTYAELGFPEKGKYSQAAKAWRALVSQLLRPR
jgi:XTP/dITP diphosphohydrolase